VKNQHVVTKQFVRILRKTSKLGPAVRYAIHSQIRNDPVTDVIEMAVRGFKVETGQDQCKALLIIKAQDSRAQNDRRLYCRGQDGEQVHYFHAMQGGTLSTVFRNSDLRYFTPNHGNEARAIGAFFEKIRSKNLKLLKPADGGPSDLLITQNVQPESQDDIMNCRASSFQVKSTSSRAYFAHIPSLTELQPGGAQAGNHLMLIALRQMFASSLYENPNDVPNGIVDFGIIVRSQACAELRQFLISPLSHIDVLANHENVCIWRRHEDDVKMNAFLEETVELDIEAESCRTVHQHFYGVYGTSKKSTERESCFVLAKVLSEAAISLVFPFRENECTDVILFGKELEMPVSLKAKNYPEVPNSVTFTRFTGVGGYSPNSHLVKAVLCMVWKPGAKGVQNFYKVCVIPGGDVYDAQVSCPYKQNFSFKSDEYPWVDLKSKNAGMQLLKLLKEI
jgi:hypothetical protein